MAKTKKSTKIASVFMALLMLFSMFSMMTLAHAEDVSGTWGTCPWTINSDGVLTIGAGTGANTVGTSSPWNAYKESITSVNVTGTVVLPSNSSSLFAGFSKMTAINGIANLDTANVTNMGRMFYNCSSLTALDVTGFDTANVENFFCTFEGCSKLSTLDVSSFDTSSVTNMGVMFRSCSGLTALDVTDFDTANVTNMSSMFIGCSGLTALDVTNFDTAKVTDMGAMFQNCGGLTALDVTGFDTANVVNMSGIFYGCSGLTALDVTGFDTANVTNMSSMFQNCSGLTALDVTGFDTANVTNMSSMFQNCGGLTALDVTGFETANVTNMGSMFADCKGLTALDVTGFDTANVVNMGAMFADCKGLTALDVSGFDTAKVTNIASMFKNCNGLTTLDVSGFDTANVTNMSIMFYNCENLTALDVSGFDTADVKSFFCTFEGCSKLSTLDASNFDTSSATDMTAMYRSCRSLTSLDLSNFNTASVDSFNVMFDGCFSLSALDLSGFDITNSNTVKGMLSGTNNLATLTVGENFAFTTDTSSAYPLAPTENYFPGTSGKWKNQDTEATYLNTELPNNVAATYVIDYPPVPVVNNNVISIPVHKFVTGETPEEAETFTFSIAADERNPGAPMPENTECTVVGEDVTFFDDITFPSAGEYYYVISEVPGENPEYTYDEKTATVLVVVKNGENGRLDAEISQYWKEGKDGKADYAYFTNEYEKTKNFGSLDLSKKVTGELGDQQLGFTFTVTFSDETYAFDAGNNGKIENGTGTITLKHGQHVLFTNIPADATYTITETNGTSYDTSINGTLKADKKAEGTIVKDVQTKVEYVNNLDYISVVGLGTDMIPFIALAILAIGGLGFIVVRKRKFQ